MGEALINMSNQWMDESLKLILMEELKYFMIGRMLRGGLLIFLVFITKQIR